MMQRLVDDVLGVAKESIKAFSHESFNQTVRLINGFSALVLAVLPDQSSLEGMQGWELRPKLRAPRLPNWMENGVSSFNAFVHDYESDEDLDYDSEYESGWDDDSLPPSSPCSTTSRASSFGRHRRHMTLWRRLLCAFFWPLRIWFRVFSRSSTPAPTPRGPRDLRTSSSSSLGRMYRGMKDYVTPNLYIDRRKGVIEDMQFWMELLIERVFEVVQSLVHYSLSPLKTLKLLLCWLFFGKSSGDASAEVVSSSTLGDSNPALQKQAKQKQGLNMDGRTCEDVIRDLGYPYEALRVTTDDGYILLLERIPRPQSRKVLYLQHGILDSSLGWVSNGVVGSQAFAAFDQGYDVFLGNLRGLVSREHVDARISARKYWNYSVNEHGTLDVAAMLAKIDELKTTELPNASSAGPERPPYSLCGVAHSLGGASMLMYVVTRRLEAKPHHLSRLVLLSPAGFHEDAPPVCLLMSYLLPVFSPLLLPLLPGLYIPTRFFRGLLNKLARDFHSYPAVGGLVQTLISWMVGGDTSNWVSALGMTHYNMNDMPGLALKVTVHLAQMTSSTRFRMFDFGSADANLVAYGMREPLDIGAHYGMIDIPVDFVAGRRDKIVPPSMVKRHFQTLKRAGCETSYDEFEYAHLDFTMSHKEELQAYVMSRLLLVTPPSQPRRKSLKKPRTVVTPSTSQPEPERAVTHESSSVTAGSVATEAHEESSAREPPLYAESFYDSSLFAFPSKEVVSIMSSRGGIVTRVSGTVAAKDQSRSSKLAGRLSREPTL